MKELFMLIEHYPNYSVSNKGRVMNIKTKKILVQTLNPSGYPQVQLSSSSGKKTFRVHRLVAMCFIPNPNNKPYVNHMDGVKTNNRYTNLEWVTAQENTLHAQLNGLKNDSKPIVAIHIETGTKTVFSSIGECATYFKTNRGSIHRVLAGKRNKFKGYKFEYTCR